MEFPLKPKGSTMGFAVEASRSGSRPRSGVPPQLPPLARRQLQHELSALVGATRCRSASAPWWQEADF